MGQDSLITEEMKNLVGMTTEPITYEVERGHIKRFAEAVGDQNPLWQNEAQARKTAYGGVVAPPTFLRSIAIPDPIDIPHALALDAGSKWEYYQPIKPGDTITVVQKVIEVTEKQGRHGPMILATVEITYTNQFGELVIKQLSSGLYLSIENEASGG